MDAVASLLDGPRARGAFLIRSVLDPPWCLSIEDEAPLTIVAVVRGHAWIVPSWGAEPVLLQAGGTAIVRGPDHYLVADDPATAPQVVVPPGQDCYPLPGTRPEPLQELGVRTWGSNPDGETVMLTGTYQQVGEVSRRLMNALPPMAVLEQGDDTLTALLAREVVKDDPGQEAVLDRLLDLLLIATVRSWFTRPEAQAPGWYAAHADPVVGPALRLLQHEPARPWTLKDLAEECSISRAALARRFHEQVGEPPMTFLTEWRLALAADLLLEPGATVGSVAAEVGYGSAFALSAAFKRVRGLSPAEHRRRAREGTAAA